MLKLLNNARDKGLEYEQQVRQVAQICIAREGKIKETAGKISTLENEIETLRREAKLNAVTSAKEGVSSSKKSVSTLRDEIAKANEEIESHSKLIRKEQQDIDSVLVPLKTRLRELEQVSPRP
ncbi:MAG: hypothetical protein P4M11_10345 [Candidatus Pacebacteria bacterium]|nr:hypothetical protein [Candidatus Paceibacterota bacterium]